MRSLPLEQPQRCRSVPHAPCRSSNRLLQRGDHRRPFVGRQIRDVGEELLRRSVSDVSSGFTPSARDSPATAAATPPACAIHASSSSCLAIASSIASANVYVRRDRDRGGKRAAEVAVGLRRGFEQHAHAQPLDQLGARAVLQHLEARRDIRLERKLVQQPRAERVDGLHLQSARRVERLREQASRMRALLHVRPAALDAGDLGVERLVGERRPFRQRLEHAVRHVGGGGLGVGEAEDLLRRRAAQQQPDHALRQHMGLARARIGGDPGRRGRVGRGVLDVEDIGGNLHSTPSSSSPPADHSATRARWS